MGNYLTIIDPTNFQGWDELVASAGCRSTFLSSSWARVFSETYNYRPYYFSLINDGLLAGLIPLIEVKSSITGLRAVSLPFTDYCDPVITEKNVFEDIFEEVISFAEGKGWEYIEFRGGEQFFSGQEPSSAYYLHEIDVSKEDKANLKQLRDSTRRNIDKAKKSGVIIEKKTDLNALKTFYSMHKKTRKTHGVPPQPFAFFENIHKYIIARGEGVVILAGHQNKIVAGAIFLSFGHEAVYKFGASSEDKSKIRPNNLVMWEAIKWCSENGISRLSLGRTDLNSTGLLQYKRGWGGKETLLNYYRFDLRSKSFTVEKPGLTSKLGKLFQLTPEPILTKVGEISYRHFG
jgi:hypothetical protein